MDKDKSSEAAVDKTLHVVTLTVVVQGFAASGAVFEYCEGVKAVDGRRGVLDYNVTMSDDEYWGD